MNEADTFRTYTLPKLRSAGWEDDSITEQLVLTPGRIVGYLDGLQARVYALRAISVPHMMLVQSTLWKMCCNPGNGIKFLLPIWKSNEAATGNTHCWSWPGRAGYRDWSGARRSGC